MVLWDIKQVPQYVYGIVYMYCGQRVLVNPYIIIDTVFRVGTALCVLKTRNVPGTVFTAVGTVPHWLY
jgi:hypothetical protein